MTVAKVTSTPTDGHVVVAIAGDLDMAAVPAVTDALEAVLAEAGDPVVVDLSATTFLDSAGLNLLYEVAAAMRTRAQQLALVVPADNLVRRTLALTGAQGAFVLRDSVADALASSS